MAYTTIDDPTVYFNTVLYTGNYSTNAITGVGFQPDLVWIKSRGTAGENHYFFDAIRGATNYIHSDTTAAQSSNAATLTTFGSDGFTVGANNSVNKSSDPLVSWNWKANGAGASNTDGSTNTEKTSASTASGFSIVQYIGTGSAATIGHGMGVAPTAIWIKKTSATEEWFCWNQGITAAGGFLKLSGTNVAGTNNTAFPWNPQATTFGLSGDAATNADGVTYIAYCFAEKQGFSKMGSYLGNGNADGAFIYTGFKPAFVLLKNTAATEAWFLFDNKRGVNGAMVALFPDEAAADGGAADNIDLLSNGFKLRSAGAIVNSAATFIYLAIAAEPLVTSTGIPATAR
jgi:hypothetical protein